MQLRISKRYPSLVPTNMLFDRSKEFFVETDVRDGQRNGIRAMDIGGGCDSKNSVLLSRGHCALKKILPNRRYYLNLTLLYPVHFLLCCKLSLSADVRNPVFL